MTEGNDYIRGGIGALTKRELFAALITASLQSSIPFVPIDKRREPLIAAVAVMQADALIEELNKPPRTK